MVANYFLRLRMIDIDEKKMLLSKLFSDVNSLIYFAGFWAIILLLDIMMFYNDVFVLIITLGLLAIGGMYLMLRIYDVYKADDEDAKKTLSRLTKRELLPIIINYLISFVFIIMILASIIDSNMSLWFYLIAAIAIITLNTIHLIKKRRR